MSETQSLTQRQPTAPVGETVRPQLLFFFSPTSGASRRTEGFLAQVLQRNRNHATFRIVRIDADSYPHLTEQLGVTGIPTLLVVSEGEVCARLAKPTGIRPIRALLTPWLR